MFLIMLAVLRVSPQHTNLLQLMKNRAPVQKKSASGAAARLRS